jgi:beta-glucosidase
MTRNEFLRTLTLGTIGVFVLPKLKAAPLQQPFTRADFGANFKWGVATAAYQIEGASKVDGKGVSIWDTFTSEHKSRIKDGSTGDVACDFYHRYKEDIALAASMGFNTFRFSISWARILPKGIGEVNANGIAFYKDVCDCCREHGLEPWITLYHWDLPQVLEDLGGWTNRAVIDWFSEYTDVVTKALADKAKCWMILNEPLSFTSFGYMIGIHAPGHRSLNKFLASVHHACMCQSVGAQIVRRNILDAKIGTCLSCSPIEPKSQSARDLRAARRLDAMMNRLFMEPSLGMGYPVADFPLLEKMKPFILEGDMEQLPFAFDFIGLQHYFRVVGKHSYFIPYLWANQESPQDRKVETTEMGWEIYPEGIYKSLKQFSKYPIKELVVTEGGCAFHDELTADGRVHDEKRIKYFQHYLKEVLRAKNEGINVTGYLVWTLMDNFEWAEGFRPRFGLIYLNNNTQERYIKDSGYWFQQTLNN